MHEQPRKGTANPAGKVDGLEQHLHAHLEREIPLHDALQLPVVLAVIPLIEGRIGKTYLERMLVGDERVLAFGLRDALDDRADDLATAHDLASAVPLKVAVEVAAFRSVGCTMSRLPASVS